MLRVFRRSPRSWRDQCTFGVSQRSTHLIGITLNTHTRLPDCRVNPDSLTNFLRIHLVTPCCWVLLEKITVKKFPALYGEWRFITVFTIARHMSLTWARPTQSKPPHATSWKICVNIMRHTWLADQKTGTMKIMIVEDFRKRRWIYEINLAVEFPNNECSIFVWNVCNFLPNYLMSYPGRRKFAVTTVKISNRKAITYPLTTETCIYTLLVG
jgi:hypothetical protein